MIILIIIKEAINCGKYIMAVRKQRTRNSKGSNKGVLLEQWNNRGKFDFLLPTSGLSHLNRLGYNF